MTTTTTTLTNGRRSSFSTQLYLFAWDMNRSRHGAGNGTRRRAYGWEISDSDAHGVKTYWL